MGGGPSVEQVRVQLKTRPTVVVVGAGFGGAGIAKRLDKHVNIVLIDRKNHFFHNIGALRPLVDPETCYKMFIPYDRLLEMGAFIQGHVKSITDKEVRLEGFDETIKFDYVIIATGSSYAFPMKNQLTTATDVPKIFEECYSHIQKATDIVIIGGGPVGIELVGEIGATFPNINITLFQSGDKILPGDTLKDELRTSILNRIKESFPNATIRTGERVNITDEMKAELKQSGANNKAYLTGKREIESSTGTKVNADIVFFAIGTSLDSSAYAEFFKDSVNPDNGRLICEPSLQVKGYDNVFAIGDCADMGPQLGALAGDWGQGPYLENNVLQIIAGNTNKIKSYEVPKVGMMSVPLGPAQGASQLPLGGGKVVGSFVTRKMKGEGLFYGQYWNALGYKNFEKNIRDLSGKEINANLTDVDVTRLANGCKMDEVKFRQLLEGAAAPNSDGSVVQSNESKENDSGVIEENPKIADNSPNEYAPAEMASAATEQTEQTDVTNTAADTTTEVTEPVVDSGDTGDNADNQEVQDAAVADTETAENDGGDQE